MNSIIRILNESEENIIFIWLKFFLDFIVIVIATIYYTVVRVPHLNLNLNFKKRLLILFSYHWIWFDEIKKSFWFLKIDLCSVQSMWNYNLLKNKIESLLFCWFLSNLLWPLRNLENEIWSWKKWFY